MLPYELAKEGSGIMIPPEDLADMEPKILRAIPGLDLVFIAPQWLVCHKELSGNCRLFVE
tara:strand:- start:224 stop:403 length:180 start_codon:yes stop_codon:yes gene_type:complete